MNPIGDTNMNSSSAMFTIWAMSGTTTAIADRNQTTPSVNSSSDSERHRQVEQMPAQVRRRQDHHDQQRQRAEQADHRRQHVLDRHELDRKHGVAQQRQVRLHRSEPGRHRFAEAQIRDQARRTRTARTRRCRARDSGPGTRPDTGSSSSRAAAPNTADTRAAEHRAGVLPPALDHRQRPEHAPRSAQVRSTRPARFRADDGGRLDGGPHRRRRGRVNGGGQRLSGRGTGW